MDKNENGYPGGSVGGVTDNNGGLGGAGNGCGNGCGGCGNGCGNNGNRPGNGNTGNNGNRPGNGNGNNGNGNGNNGNGNGNNGNNGNGGIVGGVQNNHTCGGDGSCLDRMPIAYVYAPDQVFRMLYSANDALRHGTLFEELYKPKEVYGRE